jgi:hypothetical protein
MRYSSRQSVISQSDFLNLDRNHWMMKGLVGWWPLQEGAGLTAFDLSLNRNNGTLTSMDQASDWVTGSDMLGGRALDFDGSNDWIDCGSPNYGMNNASVTIAFWAKATDGSSQQGWLFIQRETAGDYSQWGFGIGAGIGDYGGSGTKPWVIFRRSVGYDYRRQYSSHTIDGNWHHYLVVFNGVDEYADLYVDGELDNGSFSGRIGTPKHFDGKPMAIGRAPDIASTYFNGRMSDVRLWKDFLPSAAQVREIYSNPWAPFQQRNQVVVPAQIGEEETALQHARLRREYKITANVIGQSDFLNLDRNHWMMRGLIGWWPMQEGAGLTAFDLSGNGNHGTLTSMDQTTDWVTGRNGGMALAFDGANDYVDTGKTLLTGGSAYTFSTWIRPQSTTGLGRDPFIGQWKNDTSDRCLQIRQENYGSDTRLSVYWSDDGVSTSNAIWDTVLTLSVWQHIVVVFSSGAITLYVDGVDQGANDSGSGSASSIYNGNTNFVAGRAMNGGAWDYYKGRQSDIRVYDRVFTPSEIRELYLDPWAPFQQRNQVVVPTITAASIQYIMRQIKIQNQRLILK